MTETADYLDTMLTRIKNRKIGSDAVLDSIDADKTKLAVTTTIATKIETFTKRQVAESGVEQIVARYFLETDSYLVTVSNWDTVADRESCLRLNIVPMLHDKLKLDPKLPIVLQFFDSAGNPMRHVAAPGPKIMRREED